MKIRGKRGIVIAHENQQRRRRPILEYACIALSPLPTHTMDKIECFQRKAARVCLRLPFYTPVDHSHLRRLSLSSLHCCRNIRHILLAHSIHHRYKKLKSCLFCTLICHISIQNIDIRPIRVSKVCYLNVSVSTPSSVEYG